MFVTHVNKLFLINIFYQAQYPLKPIKPFKSLSIHYYHFAKIQSQ